MKSPRRTMTGGVWARVEPIPEWIVRLTGGRAERARARTREPVLHLQVTDRDGARSLYALRLPEPGVRAQCMRLDSGGAWSRVASFEALHSDHAVAIARFFSRVTWLLSEIDGNRCSSDYVPSPLEAALAAEIRALGRSRDGVVQDPSPRPDSDEASDLLRSARWFRAILDRRWGELFERSDAGELGLWIEPVVHALEGKVALLVGASERYLEARSPPSFVDNLLGAVFGESGLERAALAAYQRGLGLVDRLERADLCLQIAELHRRLGGSAKAIEWARQGVLLGGKDTEFYLRAARRLVRMDAFEDALDVLDRRSRDHPRDADCLLEFANLLLWYGEVESARELVDRAARLGAAGSRVDQVRVDRLRGAIAAVQGDLRRARDLFESVVRRTRSDSESETWLAEICARMGDQKAAVQWLESPKVRTQGPIQVMVLAEVLEHGAEPEQLARVLQELGVTFDVARLQAIPPRDTARLIEELLKPFSGNRSEVSTELCRASEKDPRPRLRRIRVSDSHERAVREASAEVLHRISSRAPRVVLSDLDRLVERYADSPHPCCYRGELNLWLGDYDQALEDFRQALARAPARWAYVGRAAVHILRGDFGPVRRELKALRAIFDPVAGATTLVYVGEMQRRQGNSRAAVESLAEAVRVKPGRVAAWMNLALAQLALGERDEAERIFHRLRRRMPRLFFDAKKALGASVPWPVPPEAMVEVFEQALRMMRGNRSSRTVTYFVAGDLRVAQDAEKWAELASSIAQDVVFELRRALEQAGAS